MTSNHDWEPIIADLAEKLLDNELSPDEQHTLSQLLAEGPQQRSYYLAYSNFLIGLERRGRVPVPFSLDDAMGSREPPVPGVREGVADHDEHSRGTPLVLPTVGFPSMSVHGAVAHFSSGWPMAYFVATVIIGLGLVIGSFIHVSQPAPFGRESLAGPAASSSRTLFGTAFVGRITGMVDCRWEQRSEVSGQRSAVRDQRSEIRDLKSSVHLGDRFALASGLMKITYNTGADVMLQGPCTYEVDSGTGGYLAVGKLTARVEGREERRGERGEGRESSLQPLFAIRTPTATVTDLGTEFGVEVAANGACEVHVLQGLVQADFHDAAGQSPQTIQLKQGEASRYEPQAGSLTPIGADAAKFAEMRAVKHTDRRERWLTYSRELRKDPALVAYYAFEKAEDANTTTLPNLSLAGKSLDGHVEGCEWVLGRLPGKLALRFHGPGSGNKVVLPDPDRFNFAGPFSVAVWFKAERFNAEHQVLVTKGDDAWRVQRSSGLNEVKFDTNYGANLEHGVLGRTEVIDKRWHLAVAVYEPIGGEARKRLYLDGQIEAEGLVPLPLHHNAEPVWIGNIRMFPGREFDGWIDEVAIFSRALSGDDVATMFHEGSPNGRAEKKTAKSQSPGEP